MTLIACDSCGGNCNAKEILYGKLTLYIKRDDKEYKVSWSRDDYDLCGNCIVKAIEDLGFNVDNATVKKGKLL